MGEEYDFIQFEPVNMTKKEETEFEPDLEFENVIELKIALNSVDTSTKKLPNQYISKEALLNEKSYNGVSHGKVWAPVSILNTFTLMNVDVMYSYNYNSHNKPYFTSANGVNSYETGLNTAD